MLRYCGHAAIEIDIRFICRRTSLRAKHILILKNANHKKNSWGCKLQTLCYAHHNVCKCNNTKASHEQSSEQPQDTLRTTTWHVAGNRITGVAGNRMTCCGQPHEIYGIAGNRRTCCGQPHDIWYCGQPHDLWYCGKAAHNARILAERTDAVADKPHEAMLRAGRSAITKTERRKRTDLQLRKTACWQIAVMPQYGTKRVRLLEGVQEDSEAHRPYCAVSYRKSYNKFLQLLDLTGDAENRLL